VLVTTGALNGLTPRALQTLLAHELGHLQSKHAMGSGRATTIRGGRTDTGRQAVLHASREQFTPDEEAEADRAAANLMVVVWGATMLAASLPPTCSRTSPSRWGRWLSRHPFPERRVEAVVKACEEALTRPPR
jgi:predicted Zn-dependent protease